MPRMFRIVSIVVHVLVVACVFVAQLLAVGPLPIPHAPVTFVGAIPIAIVEPPPPPQSRAKVPDADSTAAPSPDAAPIVAPDGVSAEAPATPRAPASVVNGVDGSVPGFGAPIALPPPAPPPPAPPPQTPIRLHSGMQAPHKIVNVDPIYPRVAQAAHVDGIVILEAIIDAQGRVTTARVLRSIALLDQAAVDAVRQWTFAPARLNGVAVPVVMTVTVNFKLTDR